MKSDSGYEYLLCSLSGFKLGVGFLQALKPVVSIEVVYCKVFFTAHTIMKGAMGNLTAE